VDGKNRASNTRFVASLAEGLTLPFMTATRTSPMLNIAGRLYVTTGAQMAIDEDAIPRQTVKEKLRAMLPENIKQNGYIVAVNWSSYPTYKIVINPTTLEGASAKVATALEELYGVEIHHQTVSGLAAMLAGFQAGRFDILPTI